MIKFIELMSLQQILPAEGKKSCVYFFEELNLQLFLACKKKNTGINYFTASDLMYF